MAVDSSAAMIEEARRRLGWRDNVDLLRHGDLESLPVGDGELDAALMVLVSCTTWPIPKLAFAEVARCLKPGGRLVMLDMEPHERTEYREQMGHQWLGFAPTELKAWLARACRLRLHPVP